MIDSADAPGGEHGDQQFDVARQETGNLVAFLHALGQEEVGKTRGLVLQLVEGIGRAGAVTAFPEQCDTSRQRMPVATFDAGVEGSQIACECGIDGVLIIEL
ncbi:hypothetical protein D3C76_1041330 [compost metagenome]